MRLGSSCNVNAWKGKGVKMWYDDDGIVKIKVIMQSKKLKRKESELKDWIKSWWVRTLLKYIVVSNGNGDGYGLARLLQQNGFKRKGFNTYISHSFPHCFFFHVITLSVPVLLYPSIQEITEIHSSCSLLFFYPILSFPFLPFFIHTLLSF